MGRRKILADVREGATFRKKTQGEAKGGPSNDFQQGRFEVNKALKKESRILDTCRSQKEGKRNCGETRAAS